MGVKIRRADLKDLDLLVKMWKEFMEYDRDIVKKNPKIRPHRRKKENAHLIFRKFITEKMTSSDAIVYIAEVDGKPAGYNLTFIEDNVPIFSIEKLGCVGDIFIREKFRGKGVASAFRKRAFAWLKKKGIKHATISLMAVNDRAHEIYRKWGFFDYRINMRRKI